MFWMKSTKLPVQYANRFIRYCHPGRKGMEDLVEMLRVLKVDQAAQAQFLADGVPASFEAYPQRFQESGRGG